MGEAPSPEGRRGRRGYRKGPDFIGPIKPVERVPMLPSGMRLHSVTLKPGHRDGMRGVVGRLFGDRWNKPAAQRCWHKVKGVPGRYERKPDVTIKPPEDI